MKYTLSKKIYARKITRIKFLESKLHTTNYHGKDAVFLNQSRGNTILTVDPKSHGPASIRNTWNQKS